jgi:hypothetical protein
MKKEVIEDEFYRFSEINKHHEQDKVEHQLVLIWAKFFELLLASHWLDLLHQ